MTKDPWVNSDLQDEEWFAKRAKQRMDARKLPEWMKTVSGWRQHLGSGSKQKRQNKRNKIYLNYYYQSQ